MRAFAFTALDRAALRVGVRLAFISIARWRDASGLHDETSHIEARIIRVIDEAEPYGRFEYEIIGVTVENAPTWNPGGSRSVGLGGGMLLDYGAEKIGKGTLTIRAPSLGTVVKYAAPEPGEERLRFTVREDRGERVLIESLDFPEATIKPTEAVMVSQIVPA